MKKIFLVVLLFFWISIGSGFAAASGSEMVITVSGDYSVQVSIDSGEALGAAFYSYPFCG